MSGINLYKLCGSENYVKCIILFPRRKNVSKRWGLWLTLRRKTFVKEEHTIKRITLQNDSKPSFQDTSNVLVFGSCFCVFLLGARVLFLGCLFVFFSFLLVPLFSACPNRGKKGTESDHNQWTSYTKATWKVVSGTIH